MIEIITSKNSATLLKHLPDATKTMVLKSSGQASASLIGDFGGGLSEMISRGGGELDILEAGPTLLSVEDPRTQSKAEVTIESDDYRGDEDDMELAFHEYKNGEEQFFPQLGRILLNLKLEKDVWKVAELGYTIRLKLNDAKFIDSISKEIEKTQARATESQMEFALRTVAQAETSYLHKHGTYSCSLDDLSANAKSNGQDFGPKVVVDMLKRESYKLSLGDCSASAYKVAAEPEAETASATPAASVAGHMQSSSGELKRRARRAYCSDQTGGIRYSPDGSAETCFSSGKQASESSGSATGIGVEVPAH